MYSGDDFLHHITEKLRGEEAAASPESMASVAIILRKTPELETLMIKRAERGGDPWSGQIAFPGGRRERVDSSLLQTAMRETLEETGIDLGSSGKFLGYFGNFRTHTGTMVVTACVFLLSKEVEPRTNAEVSSYRWVPMSTFSDARARAEYLLERGATKESLPAYRYRDYVIWGLTHRLVTSLFL